MASLRMLATKPIVSIRIRQSTYAWLQQKSADEGMKVVDYIEYIIEGHKNTPKQKPREAGTPSELPQFDVNGNRVGRWIRNS